MLKDMLIHEPVPDRDPTRMSMAQIKAVLQERGEVQSMNGKTWTDEFVDLLIASDEQRRSHPRPKLVATVGDIGRVVKPLHRDCDSDDARASVASVASVAS